MEILYRLKQSIYWEIVKHFGKPAKAFSGIKHIFDTRSAFNGFCAGNKLIQPENIIFIDFIIVLAVGRFYDSHSFPVGFTVIIDDFLTQKLGHILDILHKLVRIFKYIRIYSLQNILWLFGTVGIVYMAVSVFFYGRIYAKMREYFI